MSVTAEPERGRNAESWPSHGDGDSDTVVDRRTFLHLPDPRAVAREAWSAVLEFGMKAVPVFVAITFAASLLIESEDRRARVVSVRWTATRTDRQAAAAIALGLCLAWVGRAIASTLR